MTVPPAPGQGWRWLRIVWGALLSLAMPGLGQVSARAWRLGVALLVLDAAISLAFHVATRLAPPSPSALAGFAVLLVLTLSINLASAIDAARRLRQPRPPRAGWFRSTWVAAALVAAVGFAIDEAAPFGWRSFSIPSASMTPALQVGDLLMADITPAGQVPARGDVVVFALHHDAETVYTKRVIGLPGDRVAVRAGAVVLNGAELPRSPGLAGLATERLPGGRSFTITAPGGMGPLNNTPDYLVPPGQVFVMGDFRDNSLDSRAMDQVGFVPQQDLLGRFGTVFWSRSWGRMFTAVE